MLKVLLVSVLMSSTVFAYDHEDIECVATYKGKEYAMAYSKERSERFGFFEYTVVVKGFRFNAQIDPREESVFVHVVDLKPKMDVLTIFGNFVHMPDSAEEKKYHFISGVGSKRFLSRKPMTRYGVTCTR